ncbi:hypothetical protein [Desulfatitalea tepidiphila]|uniref:hypothetical protein n=1 Tax=Desulfatitalea tepidiphila TaxID=1185843 RepID=UPI0006B4EE00|nr:hypothetical protein [Desulfatitalea tepidiphila]
MIQTMKPILLLTLFLSLIPIACNGGQVEDKIIQYQQLTDVPNSVWQKLSSKKIYFGHQSVGYNILDGIQALLKENQQIQLAIEENFDPESFKQGTIAHSRIGYNTDPKSKLDMFAFIAKSGGAAKADIMFFKFCYVDINGKTDVKALFDAYKNTFEQLKSNHPDTTFIHTTAPLTTIQDGPKAWAKKILGRSLGGIVENSKRHEYNEMIRKTYVGKEPVLDIATIESTFPDGRRATFESNGKTYYHLVPAYTYDGGHLNEAGRKRVAEQLLLLLVNTL